MNTNLRKRVEEHSSGNVTDMHLWLHQRRPQALRSIDLDLPYETRDWLYTQSEELGVPIDYLIDYFLRQFFALPSEEQDKMLEVSNEN